MPPYSASRNPAASSYKSRNLFPVLDLSTSIEKKLIRKHSKVASLNRILSDKEVEMEIATDIDTFTEKSRPLLALFKKGDRATRFQNLSIIFDHLAERTNDTFTDKSRPLLALFNKGDRATRFQNLSIIFDHLSERTKTEDELRSIQNKLRRKAKRDAPEAVNSILDDIATEGYKQSEQSEVTYYKVFGSWDEESIDEDDSEDDSEDDNDNNKRPLSSDDSDTDV